MIPMRLKIWLLVWTPLLWLTLELVFYPKDVYVSDGARSVIAAFFSDGIAPYPSWALFIVAAALLAVAVWLLRDPARRALGIGILVLCAVFVAWGVAAGFGGGSWSLGNTTPYGWLFQTVVVVMIPFEVVLWARIAPERTQLFVWNIHQIWTLFRSNWQGIFGLVVLAAFVLLALLAPFLAAHSYLDPNAQVGAPFAGPEWSYYMILGADEQGLSVWAEYVWSARISLIVGLLATLISSVVGTVFGIVSGFFGGWRGVVGMRTTDIFLVLPWLPFAMVLAAAWGQSYGMIILIIGITCWPSTARLVRAETLKVKELQFMERARAIGSSTWHTVLRHVLPNVFPLIFANTVLVVAIAILSETTLSFLGLGDPMNFSWGTMLRNAWLSGAASLPEWAYLIAPGASVVLVVLAFTFVGQALDAVMDPKLRKREDMSMRFDELGHTDFGSAVTDAAPEESVLLAMGTTPSTEASPSVPDEGGRQ